LVNKELTFLVQIEKIKGSQPSALRLFQEGLMSISVLTYKIGTLTPPAARPSSDPAGSQVAQPSSPSSGDANSSGHTGGGASAAPAGNLLIEAFGVAGESVSITLSATAQNSNAQQNQALGQLRQVIEQLRNSNHNAAAARLKQLLQEFHALQQLGTASARALAALAKQISAAAADLSEGGGNAAASTSDSSFADATEGEDQTPDDPANTQGGRESAGSATSPAAVSQVPAGVAPTQSIAANTVASERQHAETIGSQNTGSHTTAADASSASVNPGAVEASADHRQALLDHLKQQAGQNAAHSQAASADRDLLTEAADAVSAIQGIVKRAAEEEKEKHRGKSSTELDQLVNALDSSAAALEKALSQVEIAPDPAPSSSAAISAVGASINITI
jgi:hypothetical protein